MNLVQNAAILGLVTTIIVWLLRKLQWSVDGVSAMWLVTGVSVVIAVIETIINDGFSGVLVCSIGSDPVGAVNCVIEIGRAIAAQASVVWFTSQVIYKLLRAALGSEII